LLPLLLLPPPKLQSLLLLPLPLHHNSIYQISCRQHLGPSVPDVCSTPDDSSANA
jgi:hypothetical protein